MSNGRSHESVVWTSVRLTALPSFPFEMSSEGIQESRVTCSRTAAEGGTPSAASPSSPNAICAEREQRQYRIAPKDCAEELRRRELRALACGWTTSSATSPFFILFETAAPQNDGIALSPAM